MPKTGGDNQEEDRRLKEDATSLNLDTNPKVLKLKMC